MDELVLDILYTVDNYETWTKYIKQYLQAWDSTLVWGYNPWKREKHEREALGSQKLSLKDHFLGYRTQLESIMFAK